MRHSPWFWVLAAIVVVLIGCSSQRECKDFCRKVKSTDSGLPLIRLQQQWYANSGFAGEVLAQYSTASKNGIALDVIPGSDQLDTKQVVMIGEADFGVAGAEQVMKANEKGADLVVVGVINYRSLACFISKKEKNIVKPKDMEGHKIGTMTGTPVDLVYQALKERESLKIGPHDEIPTGWVLTGFLRDEYDVYPAFVNDEPITLQLQGIDVSIIAPSNYGIHFIGTVYFCKKQLALCCPELVQSFVNSVAEGWEIAIRDPRLAIEMLQRYDPNIDTVKELLSLQRGTDYYKGEADKVLYAGRSTWIEMAALLTSLRELGSFNFESTVHNRFISWYHSRVK